MLALVMLHAALRDARDAFAAASLLDERARLAAEAAEGERPDAELLAIVARIYWRRCSPAPGRATAPGASGRASCCST